jgi:cellulose biosynthesis protein BcsQ
MKPVIVTVAALKGGSGKTTSCVGIATSLDPQRVGPVRLLYLDPQAGVTRWLPYMSVRLDPTEPEDIQAAAYGAGVAILDTAPGLNDTLFVALSSADLVVAPVRLADLGELFDLCSLVAPSLIVPVAVQPWTRFHSAGMALLQERFGERVSSAVPASVVVGQAKADRIAIPARHKVALAYGSIAEQLAGLIEEVRRG